MKRFLNVRTLGVALVAGAAVIAVYPEAIRYLPYVLLAACPLSMLFMHGHGGHQGHSESVTPGSEVGEYVCPMHSEVRSTFPGECPICGMALKSTARASLEASRNAGIKNPRAGD
jgi:hypothetical protein